MGINVIRNTVLNTFHKSLDWKREYLKRLNPDICPFQTNGPNYIYLHITYSLQKGRSIWSHRSKSDSENESDFFLTNFDTDLHATVSDMYF